MYFLGSTVSIVEQGYPFWVLLLYDETQKTKKHIKRVPLGYQVALEYKGSPFLCFKGLIRQPKP